MIELTSSRNSPMGLGSEGVAGGHLSSRNRRGIQLEDEGEKGVESSKKVATVGPDLRVRKDWSAIENFVRSNRRSYNPRRVVLISSQEDNLVSFSEELLAFFWSRPILDVVFKEFTSTLYPSGVALNELFQWLVEKESGYLIKRLLSDVDPEGITQRQRDKAGYRGAIKLMSLTEFKLKELNCVKYRQLPDDQLPPRVTSTVGGIDHFLTKTRIVVKTMEDVARLWPNCDDPNGIKVLCIDLGKRFVVGGCALLSDSFITGPCNKMILGASDETPSPSVPSTSTSSSAPSTVFSSSTTSTTTMAQPSRAYYNLSVTQKVVPNRPLNIEMMLQGALVSIAEIESGLPPLQRKDTSVVEYLKVPGQYQNQLDDFYNGNDTRFKRHGWDAERARDKKFKARFRVNDYYTSKKCPTCG
ncbi:hypothetical protein BGX30_012087 [Mortierella sp. GBA39]|nr:hypothetical protein BGX30_012087 [Mortierella sp. GBA39]